MKTISFFSRFFLAGLFFSLTIIACQKDNFTDVPEITDGRTMAFEAPDVPPEVAQHFTAEELEVFRAGPSEAMLEGVVESRRGRWHPLIVMFEMELYHRPVTNSCEDPVICYDPSGCGGEWVGYAELYTFEGTWFGHGPITGGSTGSIHCGTGEVFPPARTWVTYRSSELNFTATPLSSEIGNNGTIIQSFQYNYSGGTGMFAEAYGSAYGRLYAQPDDLPNLFLGEPGHALGFALGWLHY